MERSTKADRSGAVAIAAAHELNNELTVIVNSVIECLRTVEPGHPSRVLLLELLAASQRCVWKASILLSFGARRNAKPVRATLERLVGK